MCYVLRATCYVLRAMCYGLRATCHRATCPGSDPVHHVRQHRLLPGRSTWNFERMIAAVDLLQFRVPEGSEQLTDFDAGSKRVPAALHEQHRLGDSWQVGVATLVR